MLKQSLIGLFAASLILTGCGGGSSSSSGYSGPTEAVAMTTTSEANTVTSYSIDAALSSSLSTLASDFTPLTSSTTTEISASPAMLGTLTKRFSGIALNAKTAARGLIAGVTSSQTYSCDSGTMIFTVNVADPYATAPTPGDSFTFTLNNCVSGSVMETGSVTFTVVSYAASTDYSAKLTFSNYKSTNLSTSDYVAINGGYTSMYSYDGTATTYSITGTSLVFGGSFSGTSAAIQYSNFSFVDVLYNTFDLSFDHDFTIASTEINGSITVNTVTPFYILSTDIYPYQGELIVTGASNATVKLVVVDSTSVNLYYDLDGDNTYETGPVNTAWSAL